MQKEISQEVYLKFQSLSAEVERYRNKLGDLESDEREHYVVLETLKEYDETTMVYRLVGNVLTERTVKDVMTPLKEHHSKIIIAIEQQGKELQAKWKELQDFKAEHDLYSPQEKKNIEESKDAKKKIGILS